MHLGEWAFWDVQNQVEFLKFLLRRRRRRRSLCQMMVIDEVG
jgi:hypothetical protein